MPSPEQQRPMACARAIVFTGGGVATAWHGTEMRFMRCLTHFRSSCQGPSEDLFITTRTHKKYEQRSQVLERLVESWIITRWTPPKRYCILVRVPPHKTDLKRCLNVTMMATHDSGECIGTGSDLTECRDQQSKLERRGTAAATQLRRTSHLPRRPIDICRRGAV